MSALSLTSMVLGMFVSDSGKYYQDLIDLGGYVVTKLQFMASGFVIDLQIYDQKSMPRFIHEDVNICSSAGPQRRQLEGGGGSPFRRGGKTVRVKAFLFTLQNNDIHSAVKTHSLTHKDRLHMSLHVSRLILGTALGQGLGCLIHAHTVLHHRACYCVEVPRLIFA